MRTVACTLLKYRSGLLTFVGEPETNRSSFAGVQDSQRDKAKSNEWRLCV